MTFTPLRAIRRAALTGALPAALLALTLGACSEKGARGPRGPETVPVRAAAGGAHGQAPPKHPRGGAGGRESPG
jgi:hypothetical protein